MESTFTGKKWGSQIFAGLVMLTAAMVLLPGAAWAANVTVDCTGGPADFTSIPAALNSLDTQGPNTITILTPGPCVQLVRIFDRERLTIEAPNGVAIVDPFGGGANVIVVRRSHGIVLRQLGPQQGFNGVVIDDGSQVSIEGCTITGNANNGVVVRGSNVNIVASILQNNGNFGLRGLNNANINLGNFDPAGGVTSSNNGSAGFGCSVGCTMNFNGANVAQNNGLTGMLAGTGGRIVLSGDVGGLANVARGNSFAGVFIFRGGQGYIAGQNTIENNIGPGIMVDQNAALSVFDTTIQNNTGDGISVTRLSSVEVGAVGDTNIITGNGGASVSCDSTALVFGDLTGISNVTCTQVERPLGPPRPGRIRQ